MSLRFTTAFQEHPSANGYVLTLLDVPRLDILRVSDSDSSWDDFPRA
jgi:hypothetical protein